MQYRLITKRLRVGRGPGRDDLVVERPHEDTKTGRIFHDLEQPTIVIFDEHCQVDIQSLLTLGAIEPYRVPRLKAEKGKEVADG